MTATPPDTNLPDYSALLGKLAASRPRFSLALRRAEENRRRHVANLLDGARFKGLEALLLWLDAAAKAYEGHEDLRRIAFLVRRVTADFETAAEAALSGYVSVAADAMRDAMEIEMLLFDFILDASRIDQWLHASPADRLKHFQPRELRKRLRGAGPEVNRFTVRTASGLDYRAHSEALHVTPTTLIGKGLVREEDDERMSGFVSDMGYWEIFEHARRIVLPVTGHLVRVGQPGIQVDLGPVQDAWARTQEMLMFLTAPAELRRELGREPSAAEVLEHMADTLSRGPSSGRPPDEERGSG